MPSSPSSFQVQFLHFDPVTDYLDTAPLKPGAILSGESLNIIAVPSVAAGSAVFSIDGMVVQTENVEPYALFGDWMGEYKSGNLGAGTHEISVTFYLGEDGTGTKLGSQSLTVTAGNDSMDTDMPLVPLVPLQTATTEVPKTATADKDVNLMFVDTENDMAVTMEDAMSLDHVSLIATPGFQGVGSASFYLNGELVQHENVLPYAMFGNEGKDFLDGSIPEGENTVRVEFHSGANGTGDLLASKEITFTREAGDPEPAPEKVDIINAVLENLQPLSVPPVKPVPSEPAVSQPEPLKGGTLANWADHIVFHFDGNNNDEDDIAAMPAAAMMVVAAGMTDKVTFLYSNNLAEKDDPGQLAAMEKAGEFVRSLGIEAHSYQKDVAGTTDLLVNLMESGKKILIIEGGPMEATYRALEETDPKFHGNILQLSHSDWNQNQKAVNRPGETEAHNWYDIGDDFSSVMQLDKISDQNWQDNPTRGFYSFHWNDLDKATGLVSEGRDVMDLASGFGNGSKKNDASDSGMFWYALTGEDDGSASQAVDYIMDSPVFADDFA